MARALFDEGRDLMAAKKPSEACPKFAASMRLDPKGGTLLNLAVCHEAEGKTATAWVEFKEALAWARRDARPEREQLAQERIAAVEPKLSRLVIAIATGAGAAGLEVRLDGAVVDRAAIGTAMPIDPGEHVVSASAPGRKKWEARVVVGAVADRKTVEVPALESEAVVAPPATPRATATSTARATAAPTATATPAATATPTATPAAAPIAGYVVGGAGVVAIGVGAYFGLSAKSKHDEAKNEHCPDGYCDATAAQLSRDARTQGWISTALFGVGLVGVGVGTYLVLSGGKGEAASTGIRVAPVVGASGGGMNVGGAW
jgi:hypothetical protein